MATADNLQLSDKALAGFPQGFEDTFIWDLIAAVILVDEAAGLRREDDFIVLHPVHAGELFGSVGVVSGEGLEDFSGMFLALTQTGLALDPSLKVSPPTGEVSEEALEAMYQKMMVTPFTFTFAQADYLHPIISGKAVTLRLMTDEQAEDVPFECATVRADGTVIQVPGEALRF